MNPQIKEFIKKAGLTENESIVYSTLLELGPSHAGLISRKSGLHRRVVYDTTEMLIKKGLIGYILKNNIKLFQASSPERILEIIKEKEESINEILPQMLLMYNKTKEKEETNFYKGKNGLKTVFEDQLEEAKKDKNKEILILGASPLAYEMLEFYFHWFDKRRQENKIHTRIIFDSKKDDIIRKIPLSKIKYLPQKYSSPLAVNVYGDKVAIILWSKENPFAIVIKNKEISQGYRNYFELMWKIAKE
jgi:sugar-specific transcriptional regulator TrmB